MTQDLLNPAELPPNPLPNHPIWQLQGSTLQARGFWHPVSSEHGILSGSPEIKSCCMQAPAKIHEQLIVRGDISSLLPQRAVTLEGVFQIAPQKNSKGEIIQLYVLDQAREIQSPHEYLTLFSLLILLPLIGLAIKRIIFSSFP